MASTLTLGRSGINVRCELLIVKASRGKVELIRIIYTITLYILIRINSTFPLEAFTINNSHLTLIPLRPRVRVLATDRPLRSPRALTVKGIAPALGRLCPSRHVTAVAARLRPLPPWLRRANGKRVRVELWWTNGEPPVCPMI